jgi:hypothetical protein
MTLQQIKISLHFHYPVSRLKDIRDTYFRYTLKVINKGYHIQNKFTKMLTVWYVTTEKHSLSSDHHKMHIRKNTGQKLKQ